MKKILRKSLLWVGITVAFLMATGAWIVVTETGTRWALNRALGGIAGLDIHDIRGTLLTNLEVVRNFREVRYRRVLLTKLDKASSFGPLFDILQAANTPVSYITCGQEVPDDIQAASVDRIESLLLGD